MKAKLREVLDSVNCLEKLSSIKMPGKVAYSVARTLGKVYDLSKTFSEQKKKLFDKYGEEKDIKDERTQQTTKQLTIKPENVEAYKKDLSEILDKEVEVDIWKIKVSSLDSLSLEPMILVPLKYLLEE